MKGKSPADLETALHYHFKDPGLLDLALTHGSAGPGPDNQRLEFLGDALLNFCVAQLIFEAHPSWPEGAMSKLRGLLVCTDALHEWAKALELHLKTGPRTPKQPGALRKPMADAMEAILAAIYLDALKVGEAGLTPVMALVRRHHLEAVRSAHIGMWEHRDSKTTLQERAAALGMPAPAYEQVSRTGPDHQPVFIVRARVGELQVEASAGSLKQAEIVAARALVERLDHSTATDI